MNITYKIKRFFTGEEGIVEKVESCTEYFERTYGRKFMPYFYRDDFGNFPQAVTFRNPLGELITRLAPLGKRTIEKATGEKIKCLEYRTYSPNHQFP